MIRVGFVLAGHKWMGGLNYFRNLFSALSLLNDRKMQAIMFIGSRVPDDITQCFRNVEIIRSTLLDVDVPAGIIRRGVNRIVGGQDPLLRLLLMRHDIHVLSHFNAEWKGGKIKKIGWIPDFQHLYFPEFFSRTEIAYRDTLYRNLARTCDCILISSNAAQRDLAKFAPAAASRSAVLPFVPDIEECLSPSKIQSLENKYGFKGPYFYIPNQFWVHKNHDVVIDALIHLKKKGILPTILLSGDIQDYRQPQHFSRLMAKVQASGVTGSFKVLGVIPYNDLLSLMHHTIALINPSLFEGWSSTVEEGKALGKTILLSNLSVHIEQNPTKGIYFDPKDSLELAEKMELILSGAETAQSCRLEKLRLTDSYHIERINFALKYQQIVQRVAES